MTDKTEHSPLPWVNCPQCGDDDIRLHSGRRGKTYMGWFQCHACAFCSGAIEGNTSAEVAEAALTAWNKTAAAVNSHAEMVRALKMARDELNAIRQSGDVIDHEHVGSAVALTHIEAALAAAKGEKA